MKRFLILLAALAFFASCNHTPKIRNYGDAEKAFLSTLTYEDTIEVLILGQNFMEAMKNGMVREEIENLNVLYRDVLYKISDESVDELVAMYGTPITDYALDSYVFSTAGVNDLTFRYTTEGTIGTFPAFKITFNPVKVGVNWFLTLKDGNMSSAAKNESGRMHPLSPAPAEIRLNGPDV